MNLKEIVPEYHSKNILVKRLFFKRIELAIELAKSKLESDNDTNVIDLGCGEGILLKLLEEKFKNIKTFGIDIEPNVLKIRKFLKAGVRTADIRDSGFPGDFFDIIFCLDVLEHFENLKEPIKEIKKILRADGLLVVSLPTENLFYKIGRLFAKGTVSREKGPSSGPHFHKAKIIENFLCSNGFKIIKKISLPSIPFLALFDIVSFKRN